MIIKPKRNYVLTPEGKLAYKVQYESVSSLNKARECLVTYQEHYKRKWRDMSSSALVFGRAIHDTFEDVMVEKFHSGYLLTQERAQQIFQWRWMMEYANAREDGLVWSGKLSPEQLQQKGFALVDLWMRGYAPGYTPADIPEPPFWIELTGLNRALYGRLDLPVKEHGGGLIDYKTSGATWDAQKPEWHEGVEFQMKVYHAGWYSIYKTWPVWVQLHRLITTGAARIEPVDMLYTPEKIQAFIDDEVKPLVKKIEEAWEKDEWPCTCGKHKPATDGKDHVQPSAGEADGSADQPKGSEDAGRPTA